MKQVENFRLNKEQAGHMKEMKRINKVKEMLVKGPLQRLRSEGEALKQLFDQVNNRQQMLMAQAPSETVNEIPGQTNEEGRELFAQEQPQI